MGSLHLNKKRPFAMSAIRVVVAFMLVFNSGSIDAASVKKKNYRERRAANNGPGYSKTAYMATRNELLLKEYKRSLGAQIQLNAKEKELDRLLLKEKGEAMTTARKNRVLYMPATSFAQSRHWMNGSKIFQIIKMMPKGAALHVHRFGMVDLDWVIQNLVYRDNVYMCKDKEEVMQFNIFKKPPENKECPWLLVKSERAKASSPEEFDKTIHDALSFLNPDPVKKYYDTLLAREAFNTHFKTMNLLVNHDEFFKDHFKEALKEFDLDNVQYIEFRSFLNKIKGLDGSTYNLEDVVSTFKSLSDEFKKQHPGFFGARVIMSGTRYSKSEKQSMIKEISQAMNLVQQFSDFFLGYDLVTPENMENPLLNYLEILQSPPQNTLPYFLLAGETKWWQTQVDENLVDAVLLNATRIGHGYALSKHPQLAKMLKAQGIGIEVTPISNQLFRLVTDLRNHAMVPLIADNFPVVISSDKPGAWKALPLSHDYFVAFMTMSSEWMGLGFLKQLALNSIKYSGLTHKDKASLMKLWEPKWKKFVEDAYNLLK